MQSLGSSHSPLGQFAEDLLAREHELLTPIKPLRPQTGVTVNDHVPLQ